MDRSTDRRTVKGLGEIALRVQNLDQMQAFYSDIIQLELMQRFDTSAFFRIAEGVNGHTRILALFDRSHANGYIPPQANRTSIDHLVFGIDLADFENELHQLRSLGFQVVTAIREWVKWRSLYVEDPEGNLVELVCHDQSVGQ